MTNLAMWSALVGALLPMLVAVIQQHTWPTWVRSVAALVSSLVAAIPTVYLQGPQDFTWSRWTTAALTILTVTLATYESFWKKTGVAPAIEAATSPTKPPPSA